jgi:hypothetical protein
MDERFAGYCVFCGGSPDTRDHVPPRVFLDEPYPENLPVVESCEACNGGASLDEEFVASLLEVATCGSVNAGDLRRASIIRTLNRKPALAAQLARSLCDGGGLLLSDSDTSRLSRVIEKIGRALWVFETGVPSNNVAAVVRWNARESLTEGEREAFLSVTDGGLFSELGSRLMQRQCTDGSNKWITLQEGRFAYAVEVFDTGGQVKIILGDYLAGQVDLDEEI